MKRNDFFQRQISFGHKVTLVAFGIFLFIILLEAGLRAGGGIILSYQEYRNKASLKQKGVYRILCLGESTTQNQYPAFLEKALNRGNRKIKFSVFDKGKVGANTTSILIKLSSYLDEYSPDMVVAMMGVNDRGAHIPYDKPASSRTMKFIRSLRVYKLARLLWLHAETRSKERRASLFNIRLEEGCTSLEGNIKNEAALKKAIELYPDNDGPYIALGRLYCDLKQMDKAEGYFKKAIRLNPWNEAEYFDLVWLYSNRGSFRRIEESLKKSAESDPGNNPAYLELGRLYHASGQFRKAEDCFKKAIVSDSMNAGAYVGLGWVCREIGQIRQAEGYFKKAIESDLDNYAAYFELGQLYHKAGSSQQALMYFDKVMDLSPCSDGVYTILGWAFHDLRQFAKSEACFKKSIELNPVNVMAFLGEGWLYYHIDKPLQAEDSFKKAVELNPRDDRAYIELGRLYYDLGQFPQAEGCFKKAVELDIRNKDQFYGALGTIYGQTKQFSSSQECYRNANQLRLSSYNSMTAGNYHKLKEVLNKRNIKLVCVQYPMRNIEPLKKIFQGDGGGILFVDNEKAFKDAVYASGYKAYFNDMFGGDFGHCNDNGNRLLAENIAGVILAYVFNE
ncbi:MAG: tetratricopeptide repeat protein [Patescibacteria group bacterium]